jgi:hypothetical protein
MSVSFRAEGVADLLNSHTVFRSSLPLELRGPSCAVPCLALTGPDQRPNRRPAATIPA